MNEQTPEKHIFSRCLVCGLLLVQTCQALAQQQTIFSGLPYEEALVRETAERYSTRVEANAGAWEIPGSVSYRIFIEGLLEDEQLSLALPEPDLAILESLVSGLQHEVDNRNLAALSGICARIAQSDNSPASIAELAVLFDISRNASERELAAYYADALRRLTPETEQVIQVRWVEFSTTTNVVYTTFDMSGFALEVPEAAQAVLANGCEKFLNVTASR